jgi:hypothetical protein
VSSFSPQEETEIKEALGWYRLHKYSAVLFVVFGLCFLAYMLIRTFPPEGPPAFTPIVYEKTSGEKIENRKDGSVLVTTPSGQVRLATKEEEAEYSAWKKERYLDR